MRKAIVFALTFLVISSLLLAKQQSSNESSKEYIDALDARLRLGMTKAEVAEKVSGAEGITKEKDEWFLEGSTLQFKAGRLNYADRQWVTKNNPPVDALFGLVNSFNSEGLSQCTVLADTRSDPIIGTIQRVWLHFGKKSILVLKARSGDRTLETVSEQLGSWEVREK